MMMNVFIFALHLVWHFSMLHCCEINDTHAIILARGGSKGIKYKNLAQFNGDSLLGNTIKVIKKSRRFHNVWVSTDDANIEKEANHHGALVYNRSPYFANDHSTSIIALREFLYKHPFIQRFALFQVTSPFLKEKYIEEAVKKFEQHECVFAVKRSHKLRWKQLNYETIAPLNFDPANRPRRQDWIGELEETGMFYFASKHLVTKGLLQNQWCGVVYINTQDALEIDSKFDLEMAQCIVKLRNANLALH